MLGKQEPQRSMFQLVAIEDLVPEDHLLRRIDRAINLNFIRERVAPLYTEGWGRPSIDPELALRMMLLGYLFNLSDHQLCNEVRMHAGFRWFCRLEFHDPVPDRTTLVKLRRERWGKNGVFDDLMREVVRQCVEAGLVVGKHLALDGTQVTANASIKSLEAIQPAVSLQEYLDRFGGGGETEQGDEPPDDQPPSRSRKAGDPDFHGERFGNATHRSKTDPDARLYRKADGQEAKLRYLSHDLVDVRSGVIVATTATRATGRAEREAGLQLLDQARSVLPSVKGRRTVSADAAYDAAEFLAGVVQHGFDPFVALRNMAPEPRPIWKRRTSNLQRYRSRKIKLLAVEARNRIRRQPKLLKRRVYRARFRVEHSFAEAKQWHGLDRARSRGLEAMEIQTLLTATVQNIKRLARFLSRRRAGKAAAGPWCHRLRPRFS